MSTSVRFTLLRHGQVADRWRGRIYGDLDVPLSKAGEDQSRLVAERLSSLDYDAVISSGLSRAEFAAALIRGQRPDGSASFERRDEPDLREIHRGQWAGLGHDEVEAIQRGAWEEWWSHEGLVPPPGGETLIEVRARVVRALERIATEFPGGAVALVAHRWVVRVALCEVLGLDVERSIAIEIPYCGLAEIEWSPAGQHRLLGLVGEPSLDGETHSSAL